MLYKDEEQWKWESDYDSQLSEINELAKELKKVEKNLSDLQNDIMSLGDKGTLRIPSGGE